MAYIRYQGLSKISYVENRIVNSLICSIAPQNAQFLMSYLNLSSESHPVGYKSVRSLHFPSSQTEQLVSWKLMTVIM